MTSSKRFDVLLLGYFGFDNFGDEELLRSAVEQLVSCGVEKNRICVLSNAPQETINSLSVISVNRWHISDIVRAGRRSRSLLLPGGGLFQDTSSVRSCFYYWGAISIARMSGCKVWALGQSFAPLDTFLGRRMAISAAKKMSYISVRDEVSSSFLLDHGVPCTLMPDTAFGLDIAKAATDAEGHILFNIRPTSRTKSIDRMISAADMLAEHGIKIRGVALSPEDRDLIERLQADGTLPRFETDYLKTRKDLIEAADGCSRAIGMRFHFALFSYALGIPTVVSSYDPKVRCLAEDLHLPDLMYADDSDISDLIMNIRTKTDISVVRKYKEAVRREFMLGLQNIL